jgi:predicted RNase H-like HicB family nuclease
MEQFKFVYYQEDAYWIGWMEEYPDYRTQGETVEELKDNLRDIYKNITTGEIPHIRRYGELAVG